MGRTLQEIFDSLPPDEKKVIEDRMREVAEFKAAVREIAPGCFHIKPGVYVVRYEADVVDDIPDNWRDDPLEDTPPVHRDR